MNQETYEALKEVVGIVKYFEDQDNSEVFEAKQHKAIKQVEEWIDETAKEHEEVECPHTVLHFPGCTCGT